MSASTFLARKMGLMVNRSAGRLLARPGASVWSQTLFKSTETAGGTSKSTPPPADEFANESTEAVEAGQVDSDFVANIPEAEEAHKREQLFQQKVEQMRNVSRLQKDRLVRLHHRQMPVFTDPELDSLKSAKLYRRLYAKFGRESGIDPSLAWPTASELTGQIKFETEKGMTLEKKISILVERKTNEIESEQKVVKDSEAALKKMPKQIEEFYQRISRKYKIEEDKKVKQREILDLAREHYGYDVDPRDQKVQDFIKKVQAEKKQELKKAEADKSKPKPEGKKNESKPAASSKKEDE